MAVPRPRAKQNANKGGRESRVLHSSNVCPQVSDSLRYEVYTVRRKTNLYLCAKCVWPLRHCLNRKSRPLIPSPRALLACRRARYSARVPGRPLGTRA